MAYNLIDEQWIPVERKSGKVEMIAPAEIADPIDPPLRIASPRPDFDGALLEFLIGLLQTAAAPATERAWERAFETPPLAPALKSQFDVVREAFVLDGDGPRFMQDLTVSTDAEAKLNPIGALLIDRVGEKELDESPTLFAKPGLFAALSYPATAAALMVLQSYAPSGGAGHRTSLRGGGPLTTVILGDTLWATVWLNVLPMADFAQRVPGNVSLTDGWNTFPWLAPTRTSEKDGGTTTSPQEIHPAQHFWGLPRRFRAEFAADQRGTCGVSGTVNVPVVRDFHGRPSGTNYKGDFRHPLTPYSSIKPNEPWNPKKGGAEGVAYKDWPLFTTSGENRSPAVVVAYFASTRRREFVAQARLAAFGYAMDNMKPLRWCRAETPLVTVSPQLAPAFASEVDKLVGASEEVRKTLVSQVKSGWSDRPKDLDVFGQVNPAFWSRTESGFFTVVHALKRTIEADDAPGMGGAKEAWLKELHDAALALFDSFVGSAADLAAPDLRRVVTARRTLEQFTRPSSNSLRKILGLSFDESFKGKKMTKPRKPKNGSTP